MPKKVRGNDANPTQLLIDWPATRNDVSLAKSLPTPALSPDETEGDRATLTLPWDFRTSFPQPTEKAIHAGLITEEDCTAERLQAIHDEHAREAFATLRLLDTLLDARRRNVDPKTKRRPPTAEKQQALHTKVNEQIDRLERWWNNLQETYAEAFGEQAAHAFGESIRARHAGMKVVAFGDQPSPSAGVQAPADLVCATGEPSPSLSGLYPDPASAPFAHQRRNRRVVATLPVSRPLPAAVEAGRFGRNERGEVIRPKPDEVRAITESHASKLIYLLSDLRAARARETCYQQLEREYLERVDAYAVDFGRDAAARLDAYVRRQDQLNHGSKPNRSR